MSSSPKAFRGVLLCLACILLLCSWSSSALAGEFEQNERPEIWLVTYGPGKIYWQRFGHNAIWVRDSELGLDHVFNFGFFDFAQQDFFLRFLQGRMLYFSAARPAREEFADYINENRSIRAQRLDLSPLQKRQLLNYLLDEVRPENRDYLYDYYTNNCSTRIRDALDLGLDGALKAEFQPLPAAQSWRDHTRRLTSGDYWLYLGLEIGLGSPVDRAIDRWAEMFIPGTLAKAVASVELEEAGMLRPLVVEDVMLNQSTLDPPPAFAAAWWPRYLLLALVVLSLLALSSRFLPPAMPVLLARSWLFVSGFAGLALLFLWFGTDHVVAGRNLNLLVFCPLWIIAAFWRGHEKLFFRVVTGASVLVLLMIALPPYQYNLDVLAAFLPLNFSAALVLLRSRTLPASPPGAPASADR